MKYQSEYQRSYPRRTLKKSHEYSAAERKLNEVPIKRSSSSPSRRRGRSVPSSPDRYNQDSNFAVIGPNEKFSRSQLYRLKEPVQDHPRVAKSQEYALLGRNEKFENNVAYPLRRPVISDSPRVVVRRRKHDNHSCGIQTELDRATSASFDSRNRRNVSPQRRKLDPQSEYKHSYNWKQPVAASVKEQAPVEESKWRDRRSQPQVPSSVVKPPEKTSVAVNTPARVEIDVNSNKQQAKRATTAVPTRPFRHTSEYRARYQPTGDAKKPKPRKAFEAEEIDNRKRREFVEAERAHSDDEAVGGNVDLGTEFRKKYPHGKLRRWKSEYQSTYKPFGRFDYKDGKWYKDTSSNEEGFNPNLFWYKELVSTRKRADEYRAKAETDHFNSEHTLQLQTGYGPSNNYRAWDIDDDDDSDSVVSVDRDLERERTEGERRREKNAQRNEDERNQAQTYYAKQRKPVEKPSTFRNDQAAPTDHQVDRVVYIDEPPPKQPSAATKAFVRNLGSSSVQQHMSWDSQSLNTQRTNSDMDFQSRTARDLHRKHYTNDSIPNRTHPVIRQASPKKQQSRGTNMHSPLTSERQPNNNHTTTPTNPVAPRSAASDQESSNATGQQSYDAHTFHKRPQTTENKYCSYPGSRFKDEVTAYYYGDNDTREQQQQYPSPARPSFHNHLHTLDERYGQTYNTRNRDDDVVSHNSARSLSSSCSLASQTLERAQQNMNKYWGDQPPSSVSSPKKSTHAKH